MQIKLSEIEKIIDKTSFRKSGHSREKKFGYILAKSFANFEKYWKYLIVPQTNRVDNSFVATKERLLIDPRENVSPDLHEIGSYHYSVFLNFLFAEKALEKKQISFFENFYTHLGSICESAEEFLLKVYLVLLECDDKLTTAQAEISKEKFLEVASTWYDKSYPKAYNYFLSKGKVNPMKPTVVENLLDKYFEDSVQWKEYKEFSKLIKTYRNVIVHNYQIAYIPKKGKHYVPKKEKIQDYKKWQAVGNTVASQPNFMNHFILREKQMKSDIKQLKIALQKLWEKPLSDMRKKLFVDKNRILLIKYNLTI